MLRRRRALLRRRRALLLGRRVLLLGRRVLLRRRRALLRQRRVLLRRRRALRSTTSPARDGRPFFRGAPRRCCFCFGASMELIDSLVFLAFPLSYKNQPRQAQKSKKERARTKQDQVLRSNCCCLQEVGAG